MVLYDACLREFVEPVPLCSETAILTTAFDVFRRSSSDRLVLIDSQQHPKGIVSLQRLASHLIAAGFIGQPSIDASTINVSLVSVAPSLLEPLTLLPDDLTVYQFLPYLHSHQSHFALTSQTGELLGLLNLSRLLRLLVANSSESASFETQILLSDPSPLDPDREVNLRQQQMAHFTQQLLSHKVELEMQIQSQQEIIDRLQNQQPSATGSPILIQFSQLNPLSGPGGHPPLPLKPLLELLERLPLPIMLQTSDGQVLTQNSIWGQQIGELTDPRWLRQEAAAILESEQLPANLHNNSELGHSELGQEKSTAEILDSAFSSSVCHLGTKPGSCVCICSLKNGQEQVLQFIKIPIGKLASQVTVPIADTLPPQERLIGLHWQNLSEQDALPTFRLATLTKTADEPIEFQPETMGDRPSIVTPHRAIETPETLWLVVAQDITEQEQLAQELTAKNADLVQLNRLKDEFLACISHELRTPLTAILGLSSLLKDQTLGDLNQRQAHYARLIYQSGRHLMAVVNDILDLTRTEIGQLELDLEPVDIAIVCNRAFEQAKRLQLLDNNQSATSEEVNLLPQFSLEIEPGLEFLTADELRLRQMLIHLLTNALKFTEPEQQLGLKVGCWGGWIAFTVWDTGIGIPTDKQHLIFQKFQQLENPLTRRYEGTGLGLVLTQRLARLHGGDVSFISKEGQGSQFTILLPPHPPGKRQVASGGDTAFDPIEYPGGRVALRSPVPAGGVGVSYVGANPGGTDSYGPGHVATEKTIPRSSCNQLVLIVEAAPQFIETLSDQLIGLGYRVVIARSGTEALEKARRLQPCIIFLNPVLPQLSGWDVLTLIKSNRETQNIPVVITATKVDEEQAQHSHADGLLSLPVQAKALQQSLHNVIKSREPELPSRSSSILTVLRLIPNTWIGNSHSISETELNQLLHSRHYRILEADDLQQAELLARVWKPNVVLLDGTPVQLTTYFQEFSRHTYLASLPLVTLEQEATQAANQVPGLLVFPCLATLEAKVPSTIDTETSALLQAIQIAAGYAWKPSILVLDAATLPMSLDTATSETLATAALGNPPQTTEWLQAFAQYVQTAGFRGLIGRSWQEVLQQLQSQSIDLLLIYWTELTPRSQVLETLLTVQQLPARPPILVLDHRHSGQFSGLESVEQLPPVLKQIATQIVPPSLSMAALLDQIQLALRDGQTKE